MICNHCNNDLPLDCFHKDKAEPTGYYHTCKLCRSILKKEKYKQYKKVYTGWNTQRSDYVKNKRKQDQNFKCREQLRCRFRSSIRNKSLSPKLQKLLGYSWSDLYNHLLHLFKPDMSFDNYGTVWCIDHIKPCVMFNLTIESEIKECFSLNNIQPLYIKENQVKNSTFNNTNIRSNSVKDKFYQISNSGPGKFLSEPLTN